MRKQSLLMLKIRSKLRIVTRLNTLYLYWHIIREDDTCGCWLPEARISLFAEVSWGGPTRTFVRRRDEHLFQQY